MLTGKQNKKWFGVVVFILCCLLSAGSAWADTAWTQKAKITAADEAASDHFGHSVSISGDKTIVGAYRDDDKGIESGSAYIFKRDGANWSQQAKLLAADGAAEDFFGGSVSISNDYAIAGACGDDDKGTESGSAYIFKRNGANWSQQAKLLATDGAAKDGFGSSVSISSNYAIVGALGDDDRDSNSGSAYIFKRNGGSWSQQAKLLATDGAAEDFFGWSVSISGDYAIVGAIGDNGKGTAYIFKRNGEIWSQQAKILASDGAINDLFGWSVSISGNYAIVGAVLDDDKGDYSGSSYIFKRNGEIWSQQAKILASDGADYDQFGCSVSINGDHAIVGAKFDDDKKNDSGSVYIFKRDGEIWSQQAKLLAHDCNAVDYFGTSVSISGDYAIAGADCGGDGIDSGSAYILKCGDPCDP